MFAQTAVSSPRKEACNCAATGASARMRIQSGGSSMAIDFDDKQPLLSSHYTRSDRVAFLGD
jgi:hypothetical protein